jgi:predicted acylesterase/phospholipase RssA/ABC-type phosphate/phosphonate transport system substrate-binding protein
MKLTGVAIFILLTTGFTFKCFAQPKSEPVKTVEIKVGITEYSKIQRTYQNYDKLFRELAASANGVAQAPPKDKEAILFRFAVGTYGEVRDWYNNGDIDVAILSAMPIGSLLLAGEEANLRRAYIGDLSVSSPPSSQSVASLFSDRKPDPFYYQAGCLFARSDKVLADIANSADPRSGLRKLWNEGNLRFLFVRPYSLSGYIAPVTVLRNLQIDPLQKEKQEQMDFTYDHAESLKRLVKPDPTKRPMHQVAFVLDDSRYPTDNIQEIFGRIKLPVDDYKIPREVVLANYHQELEDVVGNENKFTRTKALMERLFKNWAARVNGESATLADANSPVVRFRSNEKWQNDFNEVQQLLKGFSLPKQLLYKSTLDDLLNDLLNTRQSRLALVLSGGGAKCSYQAGAIVEIENQLHEKFNQKKAELEAKLAGSDPEKLKTETEALAKKLDIDLVVGTSGGAINALLAAMRVTGHKEASNGLSGAWKSFKQQQFLRPSFRFRLLFGLCLALFQALLISIVAIVFGRESMHWLATLIVLGVIGIFQLITVFYFHLSWTTTFILFAVELGVVLFIYALVLLFDRLMPRAERWVKWVERRVTPRLEGPTTFVETRLLKLPKEDYIAEGAVAQNPPAAADDPHHWRKLTILLLVFFGIAEALIARMPGVENVVEYLPDTHWIDHACTAVLLLSNWSYPFPLVIGLLMLSLGYKWLPVFRRFNWLNWRGRAVAWMAIILVAFIGLLILEGFLSESSPSKVDGIEKAFVERVPALIKSTVDPNFDYSAASTQEELESISQKIMADGLLKRDLVITASKLPVTETSVALPVNSLPNDIYFYHQSNNDMGLKPPPDRSFIPLKYNQTKLVDVVIGSSTIYPIFPSRTLKDVYTGNEESQSSKITEMRIVDGGYIHNIPIKAARLWKATHIIVIEASPNPQERDPRVFLDHIINAFGYLFTQAQQDALGTGTEAFVLRPTSECEKLNVKAVCTEKDGAPEPDMDTFDFSQMRTDRAFRKGAEDVRSLKPLFVRIPGAPNFQDVPTETALLNQQVANVTKGRPVPRAKTSGALTTARLAYKN